jgi:hypothetical protein
MPGMPDGQIGWFLLSERRPIILHVPLADGRGRVRGHAHAFCRVDFETVTEPTTCTTKHVMFNDVHDE